MGVVRVLAKIVAEMVFPWLELLEGESMGWELFGSAQFEVGHRAS